LPGIAATTVFSPVCSVLATLLVLLADAVLLAVLAADALVLEALFVSDVLVSAGFEQPTIEIVMAAIKNAAKTFFFIFRSPFLFGLL
jgi:hypothetical protein